MIQRIQSIYLVLAGLFPAFTLFVPVATFMGKGEDTTLSSLGYYPEAALRCPFELVVWAVLAIVLPLVAIFLFSNRKRQIKLASLAHVANVLWYAGFVVACFMANGTCGEYTFSIGCLFPLLSILMLFLAQKAIKHDEALVRAADRIR